MVTPEERGLRERLVLGAMAAGWSPEQVRAFSPGLTEFVMGTESGPGAKPPCDKSGGDPPTTVAGVTEYPDATPDRRKARPVLLSAMTARIAEQLVRAARDRGEKCGDFALLHNQAVRELAEAGA